MPYFRLLLLWLLAASPTSATETTVWIAPTAVLEEIRNARVYTQTQEIFFMIPDLPDVPLNQIPLHCKLIRSQSEQRICSLMEVMGNGTNVMTSLFHTMQNLFTYKGIKGSLYHISPSTYQEDFSNEDEETINSAGRDWFLKTYALESRKQIGNTLRRKRQTEQTPAYQSRDDFEDELQSVYESMELSLDTNSTGPRNKRNIIKALVRTAPLFIKPLAQLFQRNGEILPKLIQLRSSLPLSMKPFLDLPALQSDLCGAEKFAVSAFKKLVSVVGNIGQHQHKPAPIKGDTFYRDFWADVVSTITSVITSQMNLMTFQTLFHLHSQALSECRNELIPMAFVPPSVFRSKLEDLEKSAGITSGTELVIKSSEYSIYYSMKTAHCSFDDEGGLVAVSIHLKPATSTYQLYQLQPVAFQYYGLTCNLGIQSSYVIRESETGTIYPVSDTDAEECTPRTTGLCRLPKAANSDVPDQYCIKLMLDGGSVVEMKKACSVACHTGTRTTFTEANDETIIVAHLPKSGTRVTCDNGHSEEVSHDVDVGAVRLTLGCGCKLVQNKLTIWSSKGVCHKTFVPLKLEATIPVQISGLDNWVPQVGGNFLGIKFNGDEQDYVDSSWLNTENIQETDYFPDWLPLISPIISTIASYIILHCFAFRYRLGPWAPIVGVAERFEMVRGQSDKCSCNQNYVLLWVVIGLLIFLIINGWLCVLGRKIKKMWKAYLDKLATERVKVDNGVHSVI